ncbi:hypothetical protein FA15DRAFT_568596, partial [Coprinopsis marcescibilis]
APTPSIEASNQTQIEDLVQRNKTLEHHNKKLREQIQQEVDRSKEDLAKLQEEQKRLQSEWQHSCFEMLEVTRIIQQQTLLELEGEKTKVIQEMKITREEKLERLKRDYKIKLFQMREEDLERHIVLLEEEKE